MIKTIKILLPLLFSQCIFAQGPQIDWFHKDPVTDKVNGIATDKTYETLLKDKASQTVVVAIIDSGVDIEHEDLQGNIWLNEDEIPNNGIDDDKNGYIDDVNGWNFIGGKNGENVGSETLEVTRLFKKLDYRYKNADPEKLNTKQKAEYGKYLKYKEEVNEKRSSAQSNLEKMSQNETLLLGAFEALGKEFAGQKITIDKIRALPSSEQAIMIGKSVSENFIVEGDTLDDFSMIIEEINFQLGAMKKQYQSELDYRYNPEYNSRLIVGDDYNDSSERYYGNNDVEGPDAFHGTHVSGIIGAVRNNDVGMNGIANNVRIMSIRTVPDGDERDKDVANAIRYAVDNGASIINMSFGKGYAWDKEAVDNAVRYANKKDVLLVHASGNDGKNNDFSDNFPNDKYAKKKLFGKKVASNWIEVGALSWQDGENLAAPFSNYGKLEVDVFAPGMAIYSTTPDNIYQNAQGTSMAAPVVAGVATVLRSYFPSLTAAQIKDVILQSSIRSDAEVKKPGSQELVKFSDLSKSGGYVNLEKAVMLASKTKGKKKVKKSRAASNKV